jgi:hypothetical protein
LDRSVRLVCPAAGVMTALASRLPATVRIIIDRLARSVTVVPWWVRPRDAMRFHAPWSRSPW